MKGILVNTEFCTGCHSCEVACKKELGLPKGEFGIKLTEVGPWQWQGASDRTKDLKGKWEWLWTPILTNACDMCADRVEQHKLPMCIQHCQAWCMYYGEVEDLAKRITDDSTWVLMTNGN